MRSRVSRCGKHVGENRPEDSSGAQERGPGPEIRGPVKTLGLALRRRIAGIGRLTASISRCTASRRITGQGRGALILGRTEGQNRKKNGAQNNQAGRKSVVFAVRLGQVEDHDDAYNRVDERDAEQKEPPARTSDNLQQDSPQPPAVRNGNGSGGSKIIRNGFFWRNPKFFRQDQPNAHRRLALKGTQTAAPVNSESMRSPRLRCTGRFSRSRTTECGSIPSTL